MKTVSFKTYALLFVALCILSSCKMTGDFAIVKRLHNKGYYIQTPSFLKNTDSRTVQLKKRNNPVEPIKPGVNTDNENLLASVNAMPSEKSIKEYFQMFYAPTLKGETSENSLPLRACPELVEGWGKANFQLSFPQNNLEPIGRDTIRKKNATKSKNFSDNYVQAKDRKTDWAAIASFASCILTIAALVVYALAATGMIVISLDFPLIYLFGLIATIPLAAIVFGYIGKHRIRKNRNTLKGKGWAITGVILGFILLYVLLMVLLALSEI